MVCHSKLSHLAKEDSYWQVVLARLTFENNFQTDVQEHVKKVTGISGVALNVGPGLCLQHRIWTTNEL